MTKQASPAYETLKYDSYCIRIGNKGTPFEDQRKDYEAARKVRAALTDWRIALMHMEEGTDSIHVAGSALRINYFLDQLPSLHLTASWKREMRKTALKVQRDYLYSIGKDPK